MPLRSVRGRLFLLLGVLLAATLAGVIGAIYLSAKRDARVATEADLRLAARVVDRLLSARGEHLATAATALAADPELQAALASADIAAVSAALTSSGQRLGASLAVVVGHDLTVIADGLGAAVAGRRFPRASGSAAAGGDSPAAGAVSYGGVAVQVAVAPVPAATPRRWIAFGFRLDDRLAGDLRDLAQLDVAFWSPSGAAGGAVLASSLAAASRDRLAAALVARPTSSGRMFPADLAEPYLAFVQPLSSASLAGMVVVLARPLSAALEPFRGLARDLAVVVLAALLASVLGAVLLARRISRPVRRLVDGANSIAEGEYQTPVPVDRIGELGRLGEAFNRMATRVMEREAEIRHRALHDPLTGLANRALFTDRLEQALSLARRQQMPLSVLLLDLDHFKEINDALGHHIGDMVLQQLGQRLRFAIRDSDTAARLGGDEYAILLMDAGPLEAQALAGKLVKALASPLELEGFRVEPAASIGIAAFPAHGTDGNALLQKADLAMYQAKEGRSGVTVYEARRDEPGRHRLSLVSELKRAADEGELKLYYQPKVDLARGEVVGVEALVRWQHPELGLLPPHQFVPLAEQAGQIRIITRWSLEEALRQCAEWCRQGLRLGVAVNLSPLDLMDADLRSAIFRPLMRHEVDPSLLALEITETAVMRDARRSLDLLQELRVLGVRLAIDDYGAGFSSLAQLRSLPVQELKIDKGFVLHMMERPDDRVVVRSTIELGHSLGLKVVAEGVESLECLQALQRLGCDLAQGYFIGRPMPAAELAAWLAASPWTASRGRAAVPPPYTTASAAGG